MFHHGATTGGDPGPGRREPTAVRRPSAGLQSHPQRMEELTRGLARHRQELLGMRIEAISALEEAISRLGELEWCSRQDEAGGLLAGVEAALDELKLLDHDTLPGPEHFYAIADRLSRLNQVLPASSGAAGGGGPADTGD